MLSYKEVFQLAIDKGYTRLKLDCKHFSLYPFIDNEAADLLMLTLIQKWLRDTHKIDLFLDVEGVFERRYKTIIMNNPEDKNLFSYSETLHNTYESALLSGIHEALQLI